MPKDRRDRSVSSDRYRASPFPSSSSKTKRSSGKIPAETEENVKEWEEARCPVCMEHPHNAVLLICTSHEKGCRPYMCDTSYRHSNCLDQFRKSFATSSSTAPQQEEGLVTNENLSSDTPQEEGTMAGHSNLDNDMPQQGQAQPTTLEPLPEVTLEAATIELHQENVDGPVTPASEVSKLMCPLCRGHIKDWIVVDAARCFMNAKSRNCACETCDYTGTYTDLRKHARHEHPLARPTEADPERQRNWRRLERQRDLGDLLSTLQSSFEEERGEDSILPMDDRGWLTVFFLIRVFQPGSSSRSSSWSGTSRARAQLSFRRRSTRLWGESYDGETISFSTEEDNESSDGDSGPWRRLRHTRRRTTPDERS